MCGIIGYANLAPIDKILFCKMRDTMVHRGPDDAGTYFSKKTHVALGHRRLSIIDLSSKGRQPISNENGTIWLSFNGEIYNFQNLRKQLQRQGHTFKSKTDAEIVVHAYEEWGTKCIEKFIGMFAFVIWDELKQTFFGARDRLGVKPMHYYYANNKFICASEIKAIIADPMTPRKIDQNALCDFLTYRYIPSPKTIWQDIKKLPPAHAFIYTNKKLKLWRYWSLKPDNKIISLEEAKSDLVKLLQEATKIRLVSDVPIGLFLSGGLDSTTIAWQLDNLNKKIDSFTIGFSESSKNEILEAQMIAKHFKHLNHYIKNFSASDFADLSDLLWYFDEPFGPSSMLPTYLVSNLAKQKVTVGLSGDGGDELFAGYNWYDSLLSKKANLINLFTFSNERQINKLAENYHVLTSPRFRSNELKKLIVDYNEYDELWFIKNSINSDLTGIKQLQWLDVHSFLPEEVLTKVDRASMANSLEVRSPLLDHRLFEFIFSLSDKIYFNNEKKYILKKTLAGKMPPDIINKRKQGFSAPVNEYWDDKIIDSIIRNSKSAEAGTLNQSYINKLINEKKTSNLYAKKWLIMIFELWYQKWC